MVCPFCNRRKKDILFSTKNFYVTPSLGQIVEGYLLICTRKHVVSLAHLNEEEFKELKKVQDKCKKILSSKYTNPIFFEHGPIEKKDKAGSCIDHAHLHVIPLKIDLTNELKKRFPSKKLKEISELEIQKRLKLPYFYFENMGGEKYVFKIPEIVPSQYIRKLIYYQLDKISEWNWREHPYLIRFNDTIKKIRGKKYHSFRITFKAVILNKNNEILLIKRRADDVHFPSVWEIPGGRVEIGENPFKGFEREIREETNLKIKIIEPLKVNYFIRDDGQKILLTSFLCSSLTKKVELNEEHTEYEWVGLKKAKKIIVKEFLEDLKILEKRIQQKH